MAKTIVIMGTLDTKGEELKYVKEQIQRRGHKTLVIDGGVLGQPAFAPDISRETVAGAVGADLKEIVAARDEGKAVAAMSQGAAKIAKQLHTEGRMDGIISIGGSMGTTLGLAVMRALPLEVPKLMVSTVAFTPMITAEQVSMDQVMIQCVVDMWGLDPITEMTLDRAAAAITAMTETNERKSVTKPLIGITTLGTAGFEYVWHLKPLLKQRGYEVVVFHAVGTGGRAFEQLIEQGVIAGALDFSLLELTDNMYGGWCDAGPNRLEAASKKGIPQVVAPGALGFLCHPGPAESLPPRWRNRSKIHEHNPMDTMVEMTKEEMVATGELIARKLNQATGPTAVLIPTQGFSAFDKPGALLYDPEARKVFTEALKRNLEPKVEVVEVDAHINDRAFAEQAVALLDRLIEAKSSG